MSLPDSTWEMPINEALFTKVTLKDGEISNKNFSPLNALSAKGSFESTTRDHNPTLHPCVDNIVVPLKNKDGTPKLDDTGNPLQVKASNTLSPLGRYFRTQETEEGYQDWAQIVGLLEDRKDPSMLKFKIAFDNNEN